MKVAISVGGRFHLFNLAQQLLKRGLLSQLITSYPKFEVMKYEIPREKIDSVIVKEIFERGWKKLPSFLQNLYNPQFCIHEVFDKIAFRHLVRADIVVGGSSMFLHTLQKAKNAGSVAIVEHGSSHIVFQNNILEEEYRRFNVKIRPFYLPHPKIIEKELKEYEEADYISIPSQFVKRTFLEKGIPESKLIQVPYGVDLSQFRQVPKTDKVFRVVFAGGISLRKGVPYLLHAFEELNLPNSELLLVGGINDEMAPFLKKHEGKFKWVGRVPQANLYKYYSQSSVFVLPSIEEGLAMVQLQAMACGLPVIATTNTGAEDVVRDEKDGFIIPIRNVEVLKSKILYLYEHPEERELMGRFAKEHVASGFTWSDYGEKMINEYGKVLKE
ncbi:MAG: glycosyltransferase family 4 protein [Candidatus Brennerbacteria bacterium]|nr:glycosyltransferase family 4 protein [Candidatus Brennerbacteria bacterium]